MDKQVLIVDDDPFAIALLGRYLTGSGCDVVRASSGVAALEVMRSARPPRIILADWMMPVMDGVELCRSIRADRRIPYAYFIILTALGEKGRFLEAMNAGADDFLNKPCDYDQLLARLRTGRRIIDMEERIDQLTRALAAKSAKEEAVQRAVVTESMKALAW